METLSVALGERSYPIFIGTDLLSDPQFFVPYIHGRQVCIVTNETVAPIYLEKLKHILNDFQVSSVVLPEPVPPLTIIFFPKYMHRSKNIHASGEIVPYLI